MKISCLLVLSLAICSGRQFANTGFDKIESRFQEDEEDLDGILDSTIINIERENEENPENITSASAQAEGVDFEQFILRSEQLFTEEQAQLEDLTVRSSSLEKEAKITKSINNLQQDQISQLLKRISIIEQKNQGAVKIQQQLLDENAPAVNTLVASDYGGVTYVRWGRTQCDGSAVVLYKGSAAGTPAGQTGGGANFLCLPEEPQWGRVIPGVQTLRSYIYGVEYQMDAFGIPYSFANNGGQSLQSNDAPCAVCHVKTRSAQIMIPARRDCPVGWVREYYGYLITSYYGHYRTSYICLDENPEAVFGGQDARGGAAWYPVESRCASSLPCPKYVDGWELACVVCTI